MNPAAILAIAALWLGTCAGAAWLGWDYRDGKVAQEKSDLQTSALQEANDNALIDMEAAAETARIAALAEAAARHARQQGVADVQSKARPDCGRDPVSMRLLDAAIAAANGRTPAPGSLPQGLPDATRTDGQ